MAKYSDFFKTSKDESLQKKEEIISGPGRFTLLFVDDEENVLNALRRVFLEENYEILDAKSGEEALRILEVTTVHLLMSDHRMPGMAGSELLKAVKEKWPEVIRIMLTGYTDIQSIMGAVNEGAVYKFITKPWNDEDLRLTISLALQQYALLQENKKLKQIAREQQVKIKNYSNVFDEYRGILGNILVKAGLITNEQLSAALKEKQFNEFISDTIVRLGFTTEAKIVQALQKDQNRDYIDLKELHINPAIARFLPQELCEKNRLLPVKLDGRQLHIAMADPSDITKIDNISVMTGFNVTPLVAKASDIAAGIKKIFGDKGGPEEQEAIIETSDLEPMEEIDIVMEDEETEVNVQELINTSGVPPIIRIVNAIILEALRYHASDIHIEPKTKYTIVRYRIDGMLHTKIRVPTNLHSAAVSRIKILAKMDISERRKPQDGRITIKTGARLVDVRVSTMPTLNGEKVVMRILDKSSAIRNLTELGMLQNDFDRLHVVIKKPQGIFISTGPTGSGKTTMLYSILYEMLQSTKNFETIEDPIEYFLEDTSQVYVRERIGLSFASVLRATLRQDPDVILVGEIRDYETADVSFKAALTGHMVLTTLHTNNTVASITRLIDIGIKPYLIASAIEGILAQRLVRTVCRYCKTTAEPDIEALNLLKIPAATFDSMVVGKGCGRCNNTGYLGRTGIFELFVMNDEFRQLISSNYRESEVMNLAKAGGMTTLIEDAIEKVKLGLTTLGELLRVIGPPTKYERKCDRCAKMIDIKFLFCPHCGTFKTNICHQCRMPLEEDWMTCPACGTLKGANSIH